MDLSSNGRSMKPSGEFRPTLAKPMPSQRCSGVTKNGAESGQRCRKFAIAGGTVCRSHGGQLPVVREKASARIEAARLRLLDSVPEAIHVLDDLLKAGTADAVRLRAAAEVLDRVGVRGGSEIKVETELTPSVADEVRRRLDALARRSQ